MLRLFDLIPWSSAAHDWPADHKNIHKYTHRCTGTFQILALNEQVCNGMTLKSSENKKIADACYAKKGYRIITGLETTNQQSDCAQWRKSKTAL